jgi:hypothetical protein
VGTLQAVQNQIDGVSLQLTEFLPGGLTAADFGLRQLSAYHFTHCRRHHRVCSLSLCYFVKGHISGPPMYLKTSGPKHSQARSTAMARTSSRILISFVTIGMMPHLPLIQIIYISNGLVKVYYQLFHIDRLFLIQKYYFYMNRNEYRK